MNLNEYFPIVNENGEIVGKASRIECHTGSFFLHPVVHLHVFNSKNQLYLQKRAINKDVQPGKWDTSVGGHVDYGEKIEEALKREVMEELGITSFKPHFIGRYKFVSNVEAELVHSYFAKYDGEIIFDINEISDGKFWELSEIENSLGTAIFTPNFEQEWLSLLRNIIPEIFNTK